MGKLHAAGSRMLPQAGCMQGGPCGGRQGHWSGGMRGRSASPPGPPALVAHAGTGRTCSAQNCSGSAVGAGSSAAAGKAGAPTPAQNRRRACSPMASGSLQECDGSTLYLVVFVADSRWTAMRESKALETKMHSDSGVTLHRSHSIMPWPSSKVTPQGQSTMPVSPSPCLAVAAALLGPADVRGRGEVLAPC